jgi:hypothetical protein
VGNAAAGGRGVRRVPVSGGRFRRAGAKPGRLDGRLEAGRACRCRVWQFAGQQAERERFALAGSEVAGFDDERQPYRISASSARQDKERPNLVHMDQIVGKLRRADGRKMDINAATGLFDTREKSLTLDGNVTVELQNTFVASMSTADVDVQKKALKSEADVLVEMNGGQIFRRVSKSRTMAPMFCSARG